MLRRLLPPCTLSDLAIGELHTREFHVFGTTAPCSGRNDGPNMDLGGVNPAMKLNQYEMAA